MFNYRLTDLSGHVIGVVSLETEEAPTAMIDGARFELGIQYTMPDKKIVGMMLVPKSAFETPTEVIDVLSETREEIARQNREKFVRELTDGDRKISKIKNYPDLADPTLSG